MSEDANKPTCDCSKHENRVCDVCQTQQAHEGAQNSEETARRGCPEWLEEHKWQPGQSGNPGGRPKRKPITEIYLELLDDPETRELIKFAIRERMLSNRMVGSLEVKEAAERIEGKVTQPIEADVNVTATLSDRMAKARERAKG